MSDIPNSDADFNIDVHLKSIYISANLAALGLTAPDVANFTTALTNWDTAYADHQLAQETGKAKRAAKDSARYAKAGGLETEYRALRRRIAAYPGLTDEHRAALGLPIEGEPEHPAVSSPPSSRPVLTIDHSERLHHKLRWRDEASGKVARPAGIVAAEIFFIITAQGDPIPAVESFQFLALDTESPNAKDFTSADAGKIANYIARWIHRDGSHGGWSEIARATIVG